MSEISGSSKNLYLNTLVESKKNTATSNEGKLGTLTVSLADTLKIPSRTFGQKISDFFSSLFTSSPKKESQTTNGKKDAPTFAARENDVRKQATEFVAKSQVYGISEALGASKYIADFKKHGDLAGTVMLYRLLEGEELDSIAGNSFDLNNADEHDTAMRAVANLLNKMSLENGLPVGPKALMNNLRQLDRIVAKFPEPPTKETLLLKDVIRLAYHVASDQERSREFVQKFTLIGIKDILTAKNPDVNENDNKKNDENTFLRNNNYRNRLMFGIGLEDIKKFEGVDKVLSNIQKSSETIKNAVDGYKKDKNDPIPKKVQDEMGLAFVKEVFGEGGSKAKLVLSESTQAHLRELATNTRDVAISMGKSPKDAGIMAIQIYQNALMLKGIMPSISSGLKGSSEATVGVVVSKILQKEVSAMIVDLRKGVSADNLSPIKKELYNMFVAVGMPKYDLTDDKPSTNTNNVKNDSRKEKLPSVMIMTEIPMDKVENNTVEDHKQVEVDHGPKRNSDPFLNEIDNLLGDSFNHSIFNDNGNDNKSTSRNSGSVSDEILHKLADEYEEELNELKAYKNQLNDGNVVEITNTNSSGKTDL